MRITPFILFFANLAFAVLSAWRLTSAEPGQIAWLAFLLAFSAFAAGVCLPIIADEVRNA